MIDRSALTWMGGKYISAKKIVSSFPDPSRYDIYAEPFVGAAHVLFSKPRWGHTEAINDCNNDLMNFWWSMKYHQEEMQAYLSSLLYSRSLHSLFHRSLFDGTQLDRVERACRWFYVLRTGFRPQVSKTGHGWLAGKRDYAGIFSSAIALFEQTAARLAGVQIDNRDFGPFIKLYESQRTLLYCDPPYVGAEQYYLMEGENYQAFHERLAQTLNATPCLVALSYSPSPLVDSLYPAPKWRRVEWQRPNALQRSFDTHDQVTELLFCNYDDRHDLWSTLQGDSLSPRPGDVLY